MGLPARKMEKIYTYTDYCSWPDDERWELIEGVAWNMSPAPSSYHQKIVTFMTAAIHTFLRDKPCEVFVSPFEGDPGIRSGSLAPAARPGLLPALMH